ncbi:MAG: deoxyribose-phosphate aldolase [Limisphaerales bacterium]
MTDDLASRVELLLAKPYPTAKDLETHCNKARLNRYRSVTVPSSLVELAYEMVADEGLKICCLIGYPFGQSDSDVKRYETEMAVDYGAHEIELVPCIARLTEGNYQYVLREIRDIVSTADERSVRVSIEQLLWPEEKLREIVSMVLDSGAQYITTSVAPPLGRSLVVGDVEQLRTLAGADFGLKAGGLREADDLSAFVSAGANCIGLLA